MNHEELVRLDSQVQTLVSVCRAWHQRSRADDESAWDKSPFAGHRQVSSRATFRELGELDAGLPTREPLRRWVAALTIDRATFDDFVDMERSRHAVDCPAPELGKALSSIRSLVLEVATHPDSKRRRIAARALEASADQCSTDALYWLARRHAAAIHLGLSSLQELEVPLADPMGMPALCVSVLQATEDLTREVVGKASHWCDVLAGGAALDAQEGWPMRLSPRWLHDRVAATALVDGLRIDVGPVPPTLCAASYARGLARLGASVRRASAYHPARPFCLTQTPFNASPFALGALLASWLFSPPFLKKQLGLGATAIRQHSLAFSRAFLIHARLTALQAMMAVCPTPSGARDAFILHSPRVFGFDPSPQLAGVLPRYAPSASARLVGMLHAASWHKSLVETHDEDWFVNPRAQRELREVDPLTPLTPSPEDCADGIKALVAALGEAFS